MRAVRSWVGVATASVLALLGACFSTETGNPPLEPESGIELDDLDVTTLTPPPMDGGIPTPGETVLRGGPGALPPETERLWVVDLDTADPPTEVTPAADGSFSVTVNESAGVLRLQVDEGTRRRPPLDVVLTPASVEPAPQPVGDCLSVPREALLETPGGTAVVRVVNACESTVIFDPPRARLGLLTTEAGGFALEPGAERTLEVRLTPGAEPQEDILFLEATSPAADRRVVTIRVGP